jgi:hypothetical protein
LSNVVIVTATTSAGINDVIVTAIAVCTDGRRAIGGGGAVLDSSNNTPLANNADIAIDVSAPMDSNEVIGGANADRWFVRATNLFSNNDSAWRLAAYAICANTQ